MEENLKNKIISIFEYLSKQISQEILVIDRISTNRENYDRHFMTTSRLKFKLKRFDVRISGGIARLEGEHQWFEFRANAIKAITRTNSEIDLIIELKGNMFRNITIKLTKHEENNNANTFYK